MKIAWFSPLKPEHTDIANHTERLRPALEAHFDEPRFIAERLEGFAEPATDTLYPYTLGWGVHELLPWLNLVDVPIYNLGNNPTHFCKTWFLSQAKPGIVILHDLRLHHFFEGIYRAIFYDRPRYLKIMDEHYGEPGRQAGEAYWRQELSIDHMAQRFPMTRWAIHNALAVVVHTAHAYAAVSRLTSQPIWNLPLPYAPHRWAEKRAVPGAGFTPERPAQLIIFGFLNTNRRVIEFLEALALMDERNRFELDIVGTVFNLVQVQAAVAALGLGERVRFHGHVAEEELEAVLEKADLAINLRHPTMGEASGSQLRIWDHALPSLVTKSDGYAVMPPDTVFFVRPEHERQDIQAQLRRFLQVPGHFRHAGLRGRRHLLAKHTAEGYASELRQRCDTLDAVRTRRSRDEMAARVGQAIPWAAARSGLAAERAGHYAREIARLF